MSVAAQSDIIFDFMKVRGNALFDTDGKEYRGGFDQSDKLIITRREALRQSRDDINDALLHSRKCSVMAAFISLDEASITIW